MHDYLQKMPQGVHHDRALTTPDFLAGIVPTLTTDFGRLDILTIDDGGAWFRIMAQALPFFLAQGFIHLTPGALLAPPGIVVLLWFGYSLGNSFH